MLCSQIVMMGQTFWSSDANSYVIAAWFPFLCAEIQNRSAPCSSIRTAVLWKRSAMCENTQALRLGGQPSPSNGDRRGW